MTIIILTAAYGHGHISVANAVAASLRDKYPEARVKVYDYFRRYRPLFASFFYPLYDFMTHHTPRLYNRMYQRNEGSENKFYDFFYRANLPTFSRIVKRRKPDLVISTYPVCAGIVSTFKARTRSDLPSATFITDVSASEEWVFPHTDAYFVPCETVGESLEAHGIARSSIHPCGIPVRKEFLDQTPSVHEHANLRVLFMGGGRGHFEITVATIVAIASMPGVDATIVCGSNAALQAQLETRLGARARVLGYSRDIATLARTNDVLVSKAGGITMFEAIRSGIPLLSRKPVLGQEQKNAEFIAKEGIGFIASSDAELREKVAELVGDRSALRECVANTGRLSRRLNPDYLEALGGIMGAGRRR